MSGNRLQGSSESSVVPKKRGRPPKDARPTGCENVSSKSSVLGTYGLDQNEDLMPGTGKPQEVCSSGKPDVFTIVHICVHSLSTVFGNPPVVYLLVLRSNPFHVILIPVQYIDE